MKIPVWSRKFPEGVGNYRRRRFLETGKGFGAERATRGLRSSLPVYRDRINPATGRTRAYDRLLYDLRDSEVTRMRERGAFARQPAVPSWEHGRDAYRSVPARVEVTVTWFPDRKRGTREQVDAFDKADRELQAYRSPDRSEDETYHRLNGRVNDLAAPLSGWQQSALASDLREVRDEWRQRRTRGRRSR